MRIIILLSVFVLCGCTTPPLKILVAKSNYDDSIEVYMPPAYAQSKMQSDRPMLPSRFMIGARKSSKMKPEDAILIVRNVQISHFSIKHPNLFIKIEDEEVALSPITKISSCRIESVGSFCQQEYPIKVDTLEKMNSSANVKVKLILADNKYVEGELPEAGSRTRNGLAEFLATIKKLYPLAAGE